MRTERECLAKVAEMTARARACRTEESRDDYLSLAKAWRGVARQAHWQDQPHYRGLLGR